MLPKAEQREAAGVQRVAVVTVPIFFRRNKENKRHISWKDLVPERVYELS